MPHENMNLTKKVQKYYVGIMAKVLYQGPWIILDSPDPEMINRYWNRDEMIMAMYDGFWKLGTLLYHQESGCVIRISGETDTRQWFRPVDSTKLEGRAQRNYDHYVKNLVLETKT